jgi:hypothetical protein
LGALLDCPCSFRICCTQCFYAGLEADCVEGVDGEGAVTTLGATGFAGEPWAGAEGYIAERLVHNLD